MYTYTQTHLYTLKRRSFYVIAGSNQIKAFPHILQNHTIIIIIIILIIIIIVHMHILIYTCMYTYLCMCTSI